VAVPSTLVAHAAAPEESVRLAELVAALSLGVDLGFGQPMEHVLRQCLIALRLADHLGLDDAERLNVYYTALLVSVGCHTDAHEQAKWFGDDLTMKTGKYTYPTKSLAGTASMLRMIGAGNPPLHRFRIGLEFAISGWRDVAAMIDHHSALARRFAEQLGLSESVQTSVGSSYEQWDGSGWPGALSGENIPIAARVAQMAEYIEVAHRLGGIEAAQAMAKERAGTQFDPHLAQVLCANAEDLLTGLDSARTWEAVIAAEPALGLRLRGVQFDDALTAVADFVDLKSPYTLGHARAVASLVDAAAGISGQPARDRAVLRRAGLIHGFGRLGVSNSIWDKKGPLGAGEWERVRMQPYLTDRMLHQSTALAPLGAIAVQLRERLDGSGYPRGLSGAAVSHPARMLGAADAYQSMLEPRPHRPALAPRQAADALRAEVKSGRLDSVAVEAVLEAAGHRVRRRREGPAGLTMREVDVLRLLALGLSSREIAERLQISPKTARNHTEHIYTKIGATNRSTASLFAMQHGLLSDTEIVWA